MLSRRNILAATSGAAAIATAGTQQAMARRRRCQNRSLQSNRCAKRIPCGPLCHARSGKPDELCRRLQEMERYRPRRPRWPLSINAFLRSKGLQIGETDLGYEECFKIMLEDPSYAAKTRLERSAQALMWDRAMRAFHGEADKYLTLMEETDNAGPGSLELNPDMDLPDYTCHEIHNQPGGFVGDPFAGWVYHWALTQAFYQGRNEYDQVHLAIAQSCPKPADGEVRRILDVGCASGLSTTAYKERFPNAEVWGIDVGAPLVRYAHHRAVKKDMDVHFAQRLGEDTKFPRWLLRHRFRLHLVPRSERPGGDKNRA